VLAGGEVHSPGEFWHLRAALVAYRGDGL